MSFLDMLFPILLGVGTQQIFGGIKKVSKLVDRLPAPFQQLSVVVIAAGVTWGSQYIPGLDQIISMADPSLAASISAATAFGVHRPSRLREK